MRRVPRLPKLAMAFAAIMAATSCGPAPSPKDSKAREEALRVQHVLGLEYPYRLVARNAFRDGSLGFVVRDRWGEQFTFFFKAQPRVPMDTSSADTLRMAPRFFLSNGDFRTLRGAHKLPIGGQEESAILDMLDVISLDQFARPVRDSLLANVAIRDAKTMNGLSEAQRDALVAASLSVTARNRDPWGMVVWIRGKGWQIR